MVTFGQTCVQQRERKTHYHKKYVAHEKVYKPNLLSKYALREEVTPWVIKYPGE
jgi:hypothetical protein